MLSKLTLAQLPLALGMKSSKWYGLRWGSQQAREISWPKRGDNASSDNKLVWTAQFQQQLDWDNFPNAIYMNALSIQRLKLRQNVKRFLSIQISALEHDALPSRVNERLTVFSAVIWDKSQFTKHRNLGTSHPFTLTQLMNAFLRFVTLMYL